MKKSFVTLVAVIIGCVFVSGAVFSPTQAEAKKAKDVRFTIAAALYPEFAEMIGLNIYLNNYIGLSQLHPALKGKIKFRIYDKGMLYGNQDEALQAVSSGAVEMTYSGPHYLEAFAREFKLGEAPGVFDSWQHFRRTMKTPPWKALQEKIAKDKGITIVKWIFDTGSWFFYTSKGPVKTLEDIKGQKIRFAGGEGFAKALKALGTTPIALPYTEVVTALQTNMIDGLITDIVGGAAYYGLERYTKYAVWIPIAIQPICWVVNTKWWESLDPKIRTALELPFERIDLDSFYINLEQQKIKEWTNKPKLSGIYLAQDEAKRWRKAMREAAKDVLSGIDQKYLDAIESAR